MNYGFATRIDAERWSGHEDTIAAAIAKAIVELHDGEHLPVSICEIEPPSLSYDFIAESVVNDLQCQLEDEVGEVADTFGPFSPDTMGELEKAIQGWVEKHGDITCWKAVNMKEYKPGDAEYDAAISKAAQ